MTIIRIGISSAATATGLSDYNDVQVNNGTVVADLLDINGDPTGISFVSDTNLSDSATDNNVTGDVTPFVKAALDYYQFVNANVKFTLAGFSASESVIFSFIGHSSTQSTRDCDVTIDGNTQTYDVSGTTTPTASLVMTESADGSGNYVVDFASTVANNTYFSAIQLEFGAGTASIDTNDDPISMDSTSAHTVSDFGSTIDEANISRNSIQIDASSPSDTAATWADLSQGLVIPEPGTGATLTVGDGTDTANVTLEFLPPTGRTYTAVGTPSGSLTDEDWGFGLGLTSADGYITRNADSAIATHNDDGTTTWLDYGTTEVYGWDAIESGVGSDGGLTKITLINAASGGGSIVRPIISNLIQPIIE